MSAIIYYVVHFWCTVFRETACIYYSVICDILFDDAATSAIGLQRPALTNADWLHWLTCYIFTRESSYCFYRILSIAFLMHCIAFHYVRPSHGWNEIGPRLLLITNRKSYTGSRLAPNSMTLNDLECQNRGFYGFLWRFRAATHVYIIHKAAPRYCRYVIQIENLVFVYKLSVNREHPNFQLTYWTGTAIGFLASHDIQNPQYVHPIIPQSPHQTSGICSSSPLVGCTATIQADHKNSLCWSCFPLHSTHRLELSSHWCYK